MITGDYRGGGGKKADFLIISKILTAPFLFQFTYCTFMKIDDLYIFEILIHFYPNLVVKMAKIIPNGCKNDVIFGKNPLPPVII